MQIMYAVSSDNFLAAILPASDCELIKALEGCMSLYSVLQQHKNSKLCAPFGRLCC
jgi:hypothetical protein